MMVANSGRNAVKSSILLALWGMKMLSNAKVCRE